MITVKDLNYCYPTSAVRSLDGFSLEIPERSLFGLLEPNGAGKTTLLSILSGLIPCPPGQVFVSGCDLGTKRGLRDAGLALVPQEYAFYSPLTVNENLVFFAGAQGIPRTAIPGRVRAVAEMTGLGGRLSSRAATLSGGLKRRLNLAVGLLDQPRLLLLDEPTVGIDPQSRHFILETIRQLNADGTTVVYTSHYMEEVESLCDQLAVIDHGKVLLQGALNAVLEANGGNLLHIRFDAAVPDLALSGFQTGAVLRRQPDQVEVSVASMAELLHVLTALQGLGIRSVRYGSHNLESLFLNLTHRALRD